MSQAASERVFSDCTALPGNRPCRQCAMVGSSTDVTSSVLCKGRWTDFLVADSSYPGRNYMKNPRVMAQGSRPQSRRNGVVVRLSLSLCIPTCSSVFCDWCMVCCSQWGHTDMHDIYKFTPTHNACMPACMCVHLIATNTLVYNRYMRIHMYICIYAYRRARVHLMQNYVCVCIYICI